MDWCEELLDMVETFKPLKHIAESGVIRKATESYIKRRMRERADWVTLEWLPTTQNKLANARSFQTLASNGRIHFPETVWAERVISQLLRFPAARYDDAVDACGLIGRLVDQLWAAKKPGKPKTLQEVWNQPITMSQMLSER
jgi:predicted phage terminase large subunit-like protein